MTEDELRHEIVWWGRSLFERGLTSGTSGNITVRCGDGFLSTPTNSCLGRLDPSRLSRLRADWTHVAGDPPTKEVALHRPFYRVRPGANAVVHLHSTHATALSCLRNVTQDNAIEALTPYVVMRLGPVPAVPYARPGSAELEPRLADLAERHPGVLLGNHGPIVSGGDLTAAVSAIEELEEAARLAFVLRGHDARPLTQAEIDDLCRAFGGS